MINGCINRSDCVTVQTGTDWINMQIRIIRVFICLLATCGCWFASGAPAIIPAPPRLAAEGYLLMDADSGHVLVEHNSQQRLPPASLTKIMTSYVAAAEIGSGRLKQDEEAGISVKAWQKQGSKMFVKEGTKVRVIDLLRGIIVQSGNDASIALAEHIAGGEDAFADVMNQHAALLGMRDTNFVNATGWPDEDHYTTAADLVKLTRALIVDYPEHYKLYREKDFTYGAPGEIPKKQLNRNRLLWRDKSVDGVKTGYTEAAGYCLVSSAVRKGMRLITVVMGATSEELRATESQKLLSYGFRYFETLNLYDAEETLRTVRVWGGEKRSIDLGLQQPVIITVPRGTKADLEASMTVQGVIKAPFSKGESLGTLSVTNGETTVADVPMVALVSVEEAGFFQRIWDAVLLFFTQMFSVDPLQV